MKDITIDLVFSLKRKGFMKWLESNNLIQPKRERISIVAKNWDKELGIHKNLMTLSSNLPDQQIIKITHTWIEPTN